MQSLILNTALAVSMFAAQKFASDNFSYVPFGESYGYSSEEMGGGGSYLGVDTRDVNANRLAELQLKEERGVEVTMVDQDAPAGKAGIKEHDVILSVNGAAVESVEQLRRMIHEIPPGRVVTIGISRGGQPVTLKAQLADRKIFTTVPEMRAFKFAVPAVPAIPAMPAMPDFDVPVSVVVVHSSARSGLMVENLTPQLGGFFGAKDGHGVLVRSVEKGSAAEKAGFRAGDVIVRVNGQAISDTGDFSHTLRSGKENTVNVGIIRDKKEQTVTLTLPERKRSELLEESFDVPEIDVETRVDLSNLDSEIAALKPEMVKYAEEVKRMKPEIEEMVKQTLQDQIKIKQSMEQLQQDLNDHQDEYRELIRQSLSGGHADI